MMLQSSKACSITAGKIKPINFQTYGMVRNKNIPSPLNIFLTLETFFSFFFPAYETIMDFLHRATVNGVDKTSNVNFLRSFNAFYILDKNI